MPTPTFTKLQNLASKREVLSIREIKALGISDQTVTRLVRSGQLERVGRGIYRLPDGPLTEHHDLINVIEGAPRAIIVLISALRFHEIGTQQAYEVWIQIPIKAHVPCIKWPPVRIIRTRVEALFSEGVEIHHLSGVDVPITTPARTVVDCFKYRNQIGLDVCLEALREVLRSDRGIITEIDRLSKITRVSRVMQPYLEAMV